VSNFPQIFGVSNFPLPPLTLPFPPKGRVRVRVRGER